MAAYWEELLPLPLDEARQKLGVADKVDSSGDMEGWLDV